VSNAAAIWIDGHPGKALPLPDRGFDFGDGLFETLLLKHGRPVLLEAHLQRLERGLSALYFPELVVTVQQQLEQVVQDIAARGWPWCALRITVSRGEGPRGYAPPDDARPRVVMTVTALDRDCGNMASPMTLAVAKIRWSDQPALAGIKHLNRLEQVLAARQARLEGADDCLMLNSAGHAISTTAGNLFVSSDGELLTAPLTHCGIVGTRRQRLIEQWAPALQLQVREAALTPDIMDRAQEMFVSNSLMGLRPVANTPGTTWDGHPVCSALFEQYRGDLL